MENYNPFSLKNKTILVTGASSGIGRAIAVECSKMGASLVIAGRNKENLLVTQAQLDSVGHQYIICDLSVEGDIEKLTAASPKLDGVVHCAGIGDRTLLKNITQEDLSRVMKINFEAPVLLQKYLLRAKKINRGSSIIFMASRAPFAPNIGHGIYAASKGALIAYAKVLGLELSNRMIRVNCICPAMVWTDLVEKDALLTGVDYHEKEKEYPLGRFGKPDDVAFLAIYLLSDAAEWVTGSCIDITGGGEFTLK